MIEFSQDNFYTYETDSAFVLLIDKNAALSGNAMKQLNYRAPEIYNALKQRINKLGDKIQVGSIIKINNFYFIVCRENYHQPWNSEAFKLAWEAASLRILSNYVAIFDQEDYEWIVDIIQKFKYPYNKIKICHHCEFGDDWE